MFSTKINWAPVKSQALCYRLEWFIQATQLMSDWVLTRIRSPGSSFMALSTVLVLTEGWWPQFSYKTLTNFRANLRRKYWKEEQQAVACKHLCGRFLSIRSPLSRFSPMVLSWGMGTSAPAMTLRSAIRCSPFQPLPVACEIWNITTLTSTLTPVF